MQEVDLWNLREQLLTSAVSFHETLIAGHGDASAARDALADAYLRVARISRHVDALPAAEAKYRRALEQLELDAQDAPMDAVRMLRRSACVTELGDICARMGHSEEAERQLQVGLTFVTPSSGHRLAKRHLLPSQAADGGRTPGPGGPLSLDESSPRRRTVAVRVGRNLPRAGQPRSLQPLAQEALADALRQLASLYQSDLITRWRDAETSLQSALKVIQPLLDNNQKPPPRLKMLWVQLQNDMAHNYLLQNRAGRCRPRSPPSCGGPTVAGRGTRQGHFLPVVPGQVAERTRRRLSPHRCAGTGPGDLGNKPSYPLRISSPTIRTILPRPGIVATHSRHWDMSRIDVGMRMRPTAGGQKPWRGCCHCWKPVPTISKSKTNWRQPMRACERRGARRLDG